MPRQKVGIMPLERLAEIHHISGVRLAKIDVEGYELEVLKSAGDLLGERIENVFVELHPAQLQELGQSIEDVERLLTSKGYVCSYPRPDGTGAPPGWIFGKRQGGQAVDDSRNGRA
jgi:hypothetical protein